MCLQSAGSRFVDAFPALRYVHRADQRKVVAPTSRDVTVVYIDSTILCAAVTVYCATAIGIVNNNTAY